MRSCVTRSGAGSQYLLPTPRPNSGSEVLTEPYGRCTTCDPHCILVEAELPTDRCARLEDVRDFKRCLLRLAVQDHRGPALGLYLVGLVPREKVTGLVRLSDLAGSRAAFEVATGNG